MIGVWLIVAGVSKRSHGEVCHVTLQVGSCCISQLPQGFENDVVGYSSNILDNSHNFSLG